MPKSFQEDGAAGAGDSGGGYNPNPTGGGFNGGRTVSAPLAPQPEEANGRAIYTDPFRHDSGFLNTGPLPRGSGFADTPEQMAGLIQTGPLPPGAGAPDTPEQMAGHWGTGLPPGAGAGFMFAAGGEVGANEQFGFDPMAAQGDLIERLAAARATVTQALQFGRKQNGLEQLAGLNRMPTAPGNQSESGAPRERPFPRLEPTQNPFGKRAEGAIPDEDDADEPVGFNPSQSESGAPRPPPGPGTLPPAPVPFGKRRQFGAAEAPVEEEVASAIPEEDEEVA
jgi:hypothetical protein